MIRLFHQYYFILLLFNIYYYLLKYLFLVATTSIKLSFIGNLLKTLSYNYTGWSAECNLAVLLNNRLAISLDRTIKIFDAINGQELKTLRGHTSSIWSLAALPDNTLASGYSDEQAIKIWDMVDGKQLKTLSGHSWVTSLVVLLDNRLASGSQDTNIKIWDIIDGKQLKTLIGHTHFVTSLAILPNNKLASGSQDKTIKIWETVHGKELKT
jgi:WD40 repeat protein